MSKLKKSIESVFEEDFEDVATAGSFGELESWDSLNYIKLVVAIQVAYGIELTPLEIQQMNSIPAIQQILEARGLDP